MIVNLRKGSMSDLPFKEAVITDTTLLSGKKILLTDDNEMNQLVASTMLKNYGAEITAAYNGAEAIARLKETTFDMVLMDVQMPVMDGIEATRIIRETISTVLPVIALTAFAISGDNLKCIEAGMNDYLSKPFEESQLLNIVSRWLGKSSMSEKSKGVAINATDPLYDLSKLKEISRGNSEFVDKMINLFIEQVPAAVAEIQSAWLNNDFGQVKKVAHRIKPSIDNMGIHSLRDEIRRIEILALENKYSDELRELILQLEHITGKVIAAIKADRLYK